MIARLRPAAVVLATAAAFLAVRLYTLRNDVSLHTIEMCDFGLWPAHLVSGPLGPPAAYMALVREGGNLIFGLVAAPVYALLGPSFYALRVSNVAWHVGTTLVFAALAYRLARWRGALLFGALWTLAPPALIKLQQTGWANHLETTLIGGLALLSLTMALDARRPLARVAWPLAAGLFGGLAVFFTYAGLSMAGGLVVAALATRLWRRGWSVVLFLAAGFGLGLIPLVLARVVWYDPQIYWELAGGDLLTFLLGGAERARLDDPGGPLWRAGSLSTVRIPEILALEVPGHRVIALGRLYLVGLATLVACGVMWQLRRRDPDGETVGISSASLGVLVGAGATVVLHLLLCVLSDFDVRTLQDRYVVPVAPFAFLLAATAAAIPLRPDRGRWLTAPALAAAPLVLGLGAAQITAHTTPNGPLHVESMLKGHRFTSPLRSHLEALSPADRARAAEQRPHDRFEILRTHGAAASILAQSGGATAWGRTLLVESDSTPPPGRPALWEGIGRSVVSVRSTIDPATFTAHLAEGPDDPVLRAHLLFGMGDGDMDRSTAELDASLIRVTSMASDPALPVLCAGVGARLMHNRYALLEQPAPSDVLQRCADEWLAVGMGMQIARETLPDRVWPHDEPQLQWWVPQEVSGREQRSFKCGQVWESRAQVAIAGEGWVAAESGVSPLVACLGVADPGGSEGR